MELIEPTYIVRFEQSVAIVRDKFEQVDISVLVSRTEARESVEPDSDAKQYHGKRHRQLNDQTYFHASSLLWSKDSKNKLKKHKFKRYILRLSYRHFSNLSNSSARGTPNPIAFS